MVAMVTEVNNSICHTNSVETDAIYTGISWISHQFFIDTDAMDSEGNIIIESQPEPEDDEFGCYFLEPSAHPYNMTEKILKANGELFSSHHQSNTKEKNPKVKFKDELISFEPEQTDEDVNSIESDNIEVSQVVQPDTFGTEEVEEAVDEVVEELISSEEDFVVDVIEQKNARRRRRSKEKKSFWNAEGVQCKDHCIDRLDFAMSMSINKVEIHEKLLLPPLQLLQRRCCGETNRKERKALPNYDGFRSEYGLTLRQLEKRNKQLESVRVREQTRRRIVEDCQQRKMQQNEEVFSQWLKEVSKRKTEKERPRKQLYSPNVISLPDKSTGRAKERPRTANCFIPRAPVKKLSRPRTTSSCVFIEVPQDMLDRSFNIGDLIITNTKSLTKRLRILALS